MHLFLIFLSWSNNLERSTVLRDCHLVFFLSIFAIFWHVWSWAFLESLSEPLIDCFCAWSLYFCTIFQHFNLDLLVLKKTIQFPKNKVHWETDGAASAFGFVYVPAKAVVHMWSSSATVILIDKDSSACLLCNITRIEKWEVYYNLQITKLEKVKRKWWLMTGTVNRKKVMNNGINKSVFLAGF